VTGDALPDEESMPYSSLFDFSRVKNIGAKVTLWRVKNIALAKQNLHSIFSVFFMQRSLISGILYPLDLKALSSATQPTDLLSCGYGFTQIIPRTQQELS
jgi:hypothetical protein